MRARIKSVEKLNDVTKLTFEGELPFVETFYTNEEYDEFREKVLTLIEIKKLSQLIGLNFDWELMNGKPYPSSLILPENPIKVCVHEPADIFENLLPLSIRCPLKFGDYNFLGLIDEQQEQVSIERKEAGNLISSITSGELSEQVQKMEVAKVKILLIEGFITAISTGQVRTKDKVHNVTWSFLWNSVLTLQMKHNLLLDFSPNSHFTAKRIKELYAYFQKETHMSDTRIMQKSFPRNTPASVKVLCEFEGYSEGTARKVLKKFGTLRNYFSASIKEREAISLIGPVKSKVIDEVLDERLEESEKNGTQ